jgi:cytochrome P450
MTDAEALQLVSPAEYGIHGRPHRILSRLRQEDPVSWIEAPEYPGFWAITRHDDISEISKQPERFLNAPQVTLLKTQNEMDQSDFNGMRTIISMDQPDHRLYRKAGSSWFTPNTLSGIDPVIDASARECIDRMVERSGSDAFDFVSDIASIHPLRVICHILGVPEDKHETILRLTNEIFGADDPDFQRSEADLAARSAAIGAELYGLFSGIIADKRANPGSDLASALANAEIAGKPMGDMETFGYYLITFTAGHETTRNAISGGLQALIEHPEAMKTLACDPSLMRSAVEEIVRWTTPVNWMVRTAAEDCEVRGKKIRKDDRMVMFYASANRDEEVFENPDEFRIDRWPNPHLGFGVGEHFCLGANLARRTTASFLRELLPRLESIEQAGEMEYVASAFVAGIKRLPIRCIVASHN